MDTPVMIYHKAYYIVFAYFHSTLTSCCFSPSTVSKQPISIFEISLFRIYGVNSVTFKQSLTVSLIRQGTVLCLSVPCVPPDYLLYPMATDSIV